MYLFGCVIVEVLSINSSIYKMIYGVFIFLHCLLLPPVYRFSSCQTYVLLIHTNREGMRERERERGSGREKEGEKKRDSISHHLLCCCFYLTVLPLLFSLCFGPLFCLPRLRNLIFRASRCEAVVLFNTLSSRSQWCKLDYQTVEALNFDCI